MKKRLTEIIFDDIEIHIKSKDISFINRLELEFDTKIYGDSYILPVSFSDRLEKFLEKLGMDYIGWRYTWSVSGSVKY